nr:synaptophysin-like protein 1 isoform X2 [Chrysemys picta bellii]
MPLGAREPPTLRMSGDLAASTDLWARICQPDTSIIRSRSSKTSCCGLQGCAPACGQLNTAVFSAPDPTRCSGTWTDFHLVGNFSSSAQFFVTFAVLVFLYCIAALVLYVGYMHLYRNTGKIPLIDLVITVMAAFLWLVSTSAWAKALTDIKISTGPSIVQETASCKLPGVTCLFASVTSMGTLNLSVVFGLLNMILWGGNAWFVYKETSLHNPSNSTPQSSGIYPPTTGI